MTQDKAKLAKAVKIAIEAFKEIGCTISAEQNFDHAIDRDFLWKNPRGLLVDHALYDTKLARATLKKIQELVE